MRQVPCIFRMLPLHFTHNGRKIAPTGFRGSREASPSCVRKTPVVAQCTTVALLQGLEDGIQGGDGTLVRDSAVT